MEVGEEVVYRLCEDPRPVDRVDRAEAVGCVELAVGEQRFYDVLIRCELIIMLMTGDMNPYLAIIKRAFDGDIVHIVVRHRCHLSFLNGRNASFWMENKDGDVRLVPKTIDRSTISDAYSQVR